MSLSIHCPHCNEKTALSFSQNDCNQTNIWEDQYRNKWWIGICNGCRKPCLVRNEGDCIYPHPLPSPTDKHIPDELRGDLDEAKRCLSVKCFRACAVMARRCVQQACLTKGCKKNSLAEQIAELRAKWDITQDIQEWATLVRWIGNDAAHPGDLAVTKDDAENILKLTEQFLHVLFVTPALAKGLRTQRGK